MIKYNKNTGNVCDKCNGFMRFDEDNDLKCMNCGRTIILRKARSKHVEQRRNKNSNSSTERVDKTETSGSNVDKSIGVAKSNIRDRYTPNQHSKMVRQRGLFRSRK